MAWDPNAAPWAWDAGALLSHKNGGVLCKEEEISETAISSSDGRFFSAEGLRSAGPPPRFHSTRAVVPVNGCPFSMSATQCDSPQTIIASSDASRCSFPAAFKNPQTSIASVHGHPCSVPVQSKPLRTIVTSSDRFMVMEDESPQTVSSSIEHLSSAAVTYPACLIPSSLALTSPPMIGSVPAGPFHTESNVFGNKHPTVDWNDHPQQGHVPGGVVPPAAKTSLALSERHGAPSLDSDKLFAIDRKGPHMWKDSHRGYGLEDVAPPGTVNDRDAKLTKLTSHRMKQHQAAMCSKQMADKFCLAKQSECKSSTQPEEQRASSSNAVQGVKDRHSIAPSLEEQHSSTVTGSAGSGESLIGLHLGKRTYFQDATSATVIQATQTSSPAPKKCRALAMQAPRCQVQGCNIELTSAKDYHRKHKVCESHSKAVKATVANQEQRFCQQCSRFHLLEEFDETKRSCRRRLAGHNERRRKPQPDPLALHARLQSSLQVWPFLHHSRYLGCPSLCQDRFDPRTSVFEDRPSYLQAPSTELQLNLKGVLHPASGSHPVLLLQNPTEMMPFDISHSHANESYLAHQYLPEYNGYGVPLASSSSSSGAGVLSGYDASGMVARVTDSGRALSLLSPQTWGLYTPNAVTLDWLGGTNMGNGQYLNEEYVTQQILQRGQPHDYGCSAERSHFPASACSLPSNWIAASERNNLEGALQHGFDGGLGVENHPLLSAFPKQDRGGSSEDVKQTIDLMQMLSSQSQHETTQGLSLPFQLGGGVFGDLQYSTYGSAF